MDIALFNAWYLKHLDLFKKVKKRLYLQVSDAIETVSSKKIVNVESRVKSPERLYKKIQEKKIDNTERIIEQISDIVGVCVICKNLSDIKLIEDILVDYSCKSNIKIVKQDDLHYSTGYRALHIDVLMPVKMNDHSFEMPCEIQVKTLAQNMWSILSHEDFYASKEKDPLLSGLQSDISDLLHSIDNISQRIRDQIENRVEIKPSEKASHVQSLNENNLYKFFKKADPEVEIDPLEIAYITQEIKDNSITTIDELEIIINDKSVKGFLEVIIDDNFDCFEYYEGVDSIVPIHIKFLLFAIIHNYGRSEQTEDIILEKLIEYLKLETCVQCNKLIHPEFFGESWTEETGEYDSDGMLGNLYRPAADWESDYYCPECFNESMRECPRCGLYTDSKLFCSNCEADIDRL